jgi:H+/gluconate symporter-like permease
VERSEIGLGALLVAILVGMAAFFIWQQWLSLRAMTSADHLSSEDRRFSRAQVWRRMTCSLLMVALAALLTIWLVSYGGWLSELMAQGKTEKELEPGQKRLLSESLTLVNLMLLALLAIIILAGWDLLAIRRYGRRHMRQIQADRRAMIEDQITRVRSQRNGHGRIRYR